MTLSDYSIYYIRVIRKSKSYLQNLAKFSQLPRSGASSGLARVIVAREETFIPDPPEGLDGRVHFDLHGQGFNDYLVCTMY